MAITADQRAELVALFLTMFGQAPTTVQLARMVTARDAGASLLDIATSASVILEAEYALVASMDAESFGTYLTNALLAADIPAEARDWAYNWVVTQVSGTRSKVDVIVEAVQAIRTTTNPNYASSTAALAAEVTTVLAVIDNPVVTPPTFELTFGTDELTGTAGNDVFTAGLTVDFAGDTVQSFEDDDILDGGAGTDTLQVTFSGGDSSAARVTDIEIINVRVTGSNTSATVDATDHVGVEQIWSDRTTSSSSLNVTNVQDADEVTLGVKNTNGDLNVGFAAGSTLNLALIDAGTTANDVTVAVTSGTIDTVAISATGANVVDIAGVGTAVEVISVSGEGSVEILNADVTALTEIDASTNAGGVVIDVSGSTLDLTVTGGAGDDEVAVGSGDDVIALGDGDDSVAFAIGDFDGNDEVDGGAGDDTLSIDATDAAALDDDVHVNFEVLSLSATAAGVFTIDNDTIGVDTIVLEDDLGSVAIDNFNGGSLIIEDAQTTDVTIVSVGADDSIDITIDDGASAATTTIALLDVTDVETVAIASAGSTDDATYTAIETDGVEALSFSGAGDVVITDITDADAANDATVKIGTLDLTGQTGGFVMDANSLGYGVTVTLGDLGNVATATTTTDYDFDDDATDDASSQIILTAGFRDTIRFTSEFDGNVAIDSGAATEFGGDVTDDRIDLSFFDITIDDLEFTDVADGLLITSEAFEGQILLVGVTGGDVNSSDFVF